MELSFDPTITTTQDAMNEWADADRTCPKCGITRTNLDFWNWCNPLNAPKQYDSCGHCRSRKKPGPQREALPENHKRCSGCKEVLPHDRFGVGKHQKDGLNQYCRECANTRSKEWYRRKKEAEAAPNA